MRKLILLISILLYFTAYQTSAEIIGLTPGDENGYEKIFNYIPEDKELQQIELAVESTQYPVSKLNSLMQFESTLNSNSGIVIMVGHNEDGVMRFADGSQITISEFEDRIERANKFGIVITCNGSCYTSHPSPRLKISFLEAFRLADKLQYKFNNMDKLGGIDSTFHTHQVVEPKPFSDRQMSKQQCAALFRSVRSKRSTSSTVNRAVSEFQREVRRTIFRSEINRLIKSSTKITMLGAGAFVLVELFDDGE